MSITAETYILAAEEHLTAAQELYHPQGRYVLSHYVAGLAVECMLRAYRVRLDPEFDSRHDLQELYKLARFGDVVPDHQQEKIGAALGTIVLQWSNNHRFRSEDALRAWLRKKGLHQGIKGDFVKERTRRIINSAADIVTVGVGRWKILSKN